MPDVNEPVPCPRCAGRGIDVAWWMATGKKSCPACGGSGLVTAPEPQIPNRLRKLYER